MGAQPTKERGITSGALTVRTARNKPRHPKDGRLQGSNIFTEHSGKWDLYFSTLVSYLAKKMLQHIY